MNQETQEEQLHEEQLEEKTSLVNEGVEEVSTDQMEEVEPSKEELLVKEVEELNDKVYRLSAEISNIQKRNAKERQDAAKYRSQSLAQNLLSVIDNLERALDIPVEGEQALSLKKGIEMVHESLLFALKEEGIEKIESLGQPFDPTKHHAVQVVDKEDKEADIVVQEFQKGYMLKDRVLRPAMVIVSQ